MSHATTKTRRRPTVEHLANLPRYELRLRVLKGSDFRLEVWQIPSSATPRLTAPEYVAGLKGSALRLIEPRLLKRLSRSKINLDTMNAEKARAWPIDEDLALNLGLLFRVLAPMRNLERIRQVADGVDEMSREEAGYARDGDASETPPAGVGGIATLADEHLMAGMPYRIVDVSNWRILSVEEMGSKPKFWVQDPDGPKWLFKHRHRPSVGDDWAEKIAAEVAEKLAIPHATVELANSKASRGSSRGTSLEQPRPVNSFLGTASSSRPTRPIPRPIVTTLRSTRSIGSLPFLGPSSSVCPRRAQMTRPSGRLSTSLSAICCWTP